MRLLPGFSFAIALAALAVCTTGAHARKPAAPNPSGAAASEEPGAAPPQPAPYEKFVKDAELADGLFTVIRKDGKVYIALNKQQLDTEFYEHATTANGLGGFGVLSGDDFEQPARIVKFERINPKNVAIVLPQYRFDAQPGTALDTAIKASTAESVQTVAPIAQSARCLSRGSGALVLRTIQSVPGKRHHRSRSNVRLGQARQDQYRDRSAQHHDARQIQLRDDSKHARLRAASRGRSRGLLARSASQL